MYRLTTFLLSVVLISYTAKGQGINDNWLFGYFSGIKFNNNLPSVISSQFQSEEGGASVSNASGNLLFYSNGVYVWDRNHNYMPNGYGLAGHNSTSQSSLIVPVPGSSTQYYLFTLMDHLSSGNLSYSIIDMTLNSGYGDILPGSKNIFLASGLTEKLVSANSSACGVWVLTHQRDNNRFEARLVTSGGIGSPVFSDAGSVHSSFTSFDMINDLGGVMKVSYDNRKIALASGRKFEVLNFDPATGLVSDLVVLTVAFPEVGYGVCFSPDNLKLYVSQGHYLPLGECHIYQYDLSSQDPGIILASRRFVGTVTMPNSTLGDMRLGKDGQIYIARWLMDYLGVIPNPNMVSPACGFINDGIYLGFSSSGMGLPNEVRTGNLPIDLGDDTLLCPGQTISLTAPSSAGYLWSTGHTGPSINISTNGQYWVTITNGICTGSDTINVSFSLPEIDLGPDSTLCDGQTLNLYAGVHNSYTWSTGAVTSSITISTPGQYWVNVGNGVCFNADTINVSFTSAPNVNLGSDTTLCNGQALVLNAGSADSYSWSTGETSSSINVTAPGQYWVNAGIGNCFKSDTIIVSFDNPPVINLGNDSTLCSDQSIMLSAGVAGSYLWSTGATSQSINVSTPGQYWVRSANGNCFVSDTVVIDFASYPDLNIGNDTSLCEGDSLLLVAGSANSWIWSDGSTSQSLLVTANGEYWVMAGNYSCYVFDTVNVLFNAYPVISFGADTVLCDGQFMLLSGGTADNYLWSTGETSQIIEVTSPGDYWVVSGIAGCMSTDTISVNFKYPPVSLFPTDTLLCKGHTLVLNAGSAPGYQWSTGETTQSIAITNGGAYSLILNYFLSCVSSYNINVVFENCDCIVLIPNAFTPNSDGLNDIFKPSQITGCELRRISIFNRYGRKVFESSDLNTGWDGKVSGKIQSGVFVWIAEIIKDGQSRILKGTINVLK